MRFTVLLPFVKTIRSLWRLLFFVIFTTRIVAEIWLRNTIQGVDLHRSMRVRRYWARRVLQGVGVRITTKGDPPAYPCLMVANHRSYLDPIIMLCDVDAWPVAKAELAGWPVIGKGAQMAGILYLRREDVKHRASILDKIAGTIHKGFPVILFPEGTTSDLTGTLPFKKGGFVVAAKHGFKVVPAALVFADKRDFWVGKDTFLQHATRRFKEKYINIQVVYGPAIQHEDAAILNEMAHEWINQCLNGLE